MLSKLDIPEVIDMISCLKEIASVYLVPPEEVVKVNAFFSLTECDMWLDCRGKFTTSRHCDCS